MLFKTMAVYLLLIGLAVAQVVYYYPRLPDNVASHFDWVGRPDGWMSKSSFLAFELGLTVFLAVLFAAIGFGTQMWACAAPRCRGQRDGAAEETQTGKQSEVAEELFTAIASTMLWFGAVTLLFILVVFQLAIQANLRPEPVMHHIIPALIGYLAVEILLVTRVSIRSRRLMSRLPQPQRPPGIWFPAKRFGWGWGLPVCWQGWVVMVIWVGMLLGGILLIFRTDWGFSPLALFYPFMIVMAVILGTICWLKGEKPRWRWGDKD